MLQLTKNFALEKKYIQGDQTLLNGIIYIFYESDSENPTKIRNFLWNEKICQRTVGFYEL